MDPSTNPYITLVQTVPDIILVNRTDRLDDADVQAVKSKLAPFPRVFVELGSGSGSHLIERAARDPSSAYVGFELRYKRSFRTAQKASNIPLRNLFVLRTPARHLPLLFDEGTIAGIYVNFPDPWDKLRWLKNRMVDDAFAETARTRLEPDGFFAFKTDHEGYYQATLDLFSTKSAFSIEEQSVDLHRSSHASENVSTEFERLFLSQKLPIYYLKMKKVGNGSPGEYNRGEG